AQWSSSCVTATVTAPSASTMTTSPTSGRVRPARRGAEKSTATLKARSGRDTSVTSLRRSEAVPPPALLDQPSPGKVGFRWETWRDREPCRGKSDPEIKALLGPLGAVGEEAETPAEKEGRCGGDRNVGGGTTNELDQRVE